MEHSLERVAPDVLTTANPTPEDLKQARADIQSNPAIREVFLQADSEECSKEELTSRVTEALAKIWPFGDPTEAVKYLIDEHCQLEKGIYLIDNETGKVAAILQEEDMYEPAMVPREGGGMAQPLKRIRPDIESAIYLNLHDRKRETTALAALANRAGSTGLLKDLGDPRLLPATRKGRKQVVANLSTLNPKDLLKAAGGTTGAFLSGFSFGVPVEGSQTFTGSVVAKVSTATADVRTFNLQYNKVGNLRMSIANSWIKDMAKALTHHVHDQATTKVGCSVKDETTLPGDLIIAPPELVTAVRKLNPKTPILPVEGAKLTCLEDFQGVLGVPDSFQAKNFDAFDRWDVFAELSYSLQYFGATWAAFLDDVEPEVQVL